MYSKCELENTTHISWACTPDDKTVCDHIGKHWDEIKNKCKDSNEEVTVPFLHFEKVDVKNKHGEMKKHLKTVQTPATLKYLLSFMENMLSKFVHHRNMLKHYRTTIKDFYDMFDSVDLDIDFSENLTLPVKHQAQSLHWSYTQITVHSGIVKVEGEKSYHPYFSDNRKHDQVFVKLSIEKMLSDVDISDKIIVVESDNCKGQYKSAKHLYDLQQLSTKLNKKVIRVYSIPGHGKGEVDHVGGIVKVAVRREIAAGRVMLDSNDIVDFLREKFGASTAVPYIIEEIDGKILDIERAMTRRKLYPTVDGSSKFQAIVFNPNTNKFKASKRICICNECQLDYGSCSLFNEFELTVQDIYQPF